MIQKSENKLFFLSQFDLISANSLLDSHLNTWLQRYFYTIDTHTQNFMFRFRKIVQYENTENSTWMHI